MCLNRHASFFCFIQSVNLISVGLAMVNYQKYANLLNSTIHINNIPYIDNLRQKKTHKKGI